MKSIGNITIFSNRTLTVVPYLENKRQRLFCSGRLPQFLIVITFVCCCFVFKCVRRREMLTLYLLGTKQTILPWKTPIVSDLNNFCLLFFFQMRAQTRNVDIMFLGNTSYTQATNYCAMLLYMDNQCFWMVSCIPYHFQYILEASCFQKVYSLISPE